MGRIMAIDYGKKRTGIAVSDPLHLIANGLTTVSTSILYDFLKDYLSKEEVETIVVGEPKQPNGDNSENMKRVIPFVNRIRKLYPHISVEYYDERYTSVLAQRAIIDSGTKKKERRENKGLVDIISATIILQDYMESRRIASLQSQ
jgi:putative Holliday junction resolvase